MAEPASRDAVALERLGRALREASPAGSLQRHLEGRARLIAAVSGTRGRSRLRTPVVYSVSFAAVAAALLFVGLALRAPAAPGWRVEGGVVGAEGYVVPAAPATSARVVFTDGSLVELAPLSRARVEATRAGGERLALEQGRARVSLPRRDHGDWTLAAGPFAVRGEGADLLLAWAADAETLDVWMRAGRASVTGPSFGDALPLSAGQHLRARARDGTAQIDTAGEETATSPPPPLPSVDEPAAPPDVNAVVPPVAPASGPTWARLVAAGDYARVLHEARDEGAGHVLGARPLGDLRALGDAARYAGDATLAKQAYSALRSRFPASGDAHTAAFLLGRLAEEHDHASADALRWYDRYLSEAPGGALAGDALGRKMTLTASGSGRDAARALAERYLRLYPQGPYASVARDLAP